MLELQSHSRAAREVFDKTLSSVDAGRAVRRAVRLEDSTLKILDTTFNLESSRSGIYSIAIGKAALPMAHALTEILGDRITAGVITAPRDALSPSLASSFWHVFAGGHPLPNQESLDAARAAFELLRRADEESALVIFLISGGGSAMIEWPRDESTTLEELREMNRALVSCGASIAEINSVRRAVSAVKGGGLSRRAPHCPQVSLIVSDTGAGQEETVASGPTFYPPQDAPDPASVIKRYRLDNILHESILRAVKLSSSESAPVFDSALRKHFVLLDNGSALEAAAEAARSRGFAVEIARDVVEQPIVAGCSLLLHRLLSLRQRTRSSNPAACLISGGEFACPVRGQGVGGRNAETALRWAVELDALAKAETELPRVVALSAGTDGIDGNSPAAGAVADTLTVERARSLNLDARRVLDESDAHTFFNALGDTVMTGPTGTNVRDLRIMIAA